MAVAQELKKAKQGFIIHREDIEEHIRISQQIFSVCLFAFFALHIVVIHLLDFAKCGRLYAALGISVLQMIFSLVSYFLFKCHFVIHKKHIF